MVSSVTARRVARPGWRAPVPVICCGNATVGGAGKTTMALDLAGRLTARGIKAHIILRGYRGTEKRSRLIVRGDNVLNTGDEALLLAEAAPTWIGADRVASAREAIAAGAELLILDDGLQNPGLAKAMSLLVIDGATGFGNGLVLPAGPLREPVAAAASRCRAAVMIGPDTSNAREQLPPGMMIMRAELAQTEVDGLNGRPVIAFTGIAIPEKFFGALARHGIDLVGREPFPDHHMFTQSELARLKAIATERKAILATTPKDAVRLPAGFPAHVVGVRLKWQNEESIEALLDELMSKRVTNQRAIAGDPLSPEQGSLC